MKLTAYFFLFFLTLTACNKEPLGPEESENCKITIDSSAFETHWQTENIIGQDWRVNPSIRPIIFENKVITSNQQGNNTILTCRDADTGASVWNVELPALLVDDAIAQNGGMLYMNLQGDITSLNLSNQQLNVLYEIPPIHATDINVSGKYLVVHYWETMEENGVWNTTDKIDVIDTEAGTSEEVYSYLHIWSGENAHLLKPALWRAQAGDLLLTFLKVTDVIESIHQAFELVTINLSQDQLLYAIPFTSAGPGLQYADFLLIDRRIFVAEMEGVSAFDGETGNVMWSSKLGSDIYNEDYQLKNAAGDLLVYDVGYSKKTFLFDAESGIEKWQKKIFGLPSASENVMVVNNMAVFVQPKVISAIDLENGCPVWNRPRPHENLNLLEGITTDPELRRLYVFDEENIYCLKL